MIDERQAAVEAILKAGHTPAGMELFAAGNKSQLETIHRWIDESDVFMLILGARYGSLEPKSGRSYTQREYEYAVNTNKPFFEVPGVQWRRYKTTRKGNDFLASIAKMSAGKERPLIQDVQAGQDGGALAELGKPSAEKAKNRGVRKVKEAKPKK